MFNNQEYIPTHLSAGTTAQIFSGKGVLQIIVVNNTVGTAFGAYDGIAVTTTPIAILKASVAEDSYEYHATVSRGLYVTYAAGDYTVLWSQA